MHPHLPPHLRPPPRPLPREAPPPIVAFLRLTGLLLLGACAAADGDPDAELVIPPVPIAMADVTRDAVARPVTGTGLFGPKDEVSLSFKVGGIVDRVAVDGGASVARGQVLAALDLREIDALLAKARVGVDKARRDAIRLCALEADSVASLSQRQDAESALAAAEADLEAVQINREFSVITAPTSGRILRRHVQPGVLVSPGQDILTLGSDGRGHVVRVGLPDRDALRVAVGQAASVTFDAMPGRRFAGRLSQRGAATDPRTGMVSVEITVTGADAMPAGTVAQVAITVPAATDVTLVPVDALIEADGDSATVYSTRDGRARRHRVRVLFLAGTRVAVEGLEIVGRVVTRGAPYLRDGSAVREVAGNLDGVPTALRSPAPGADQ